MKKIFFAVAFSISLSSFAQEGKTYNIIHSSNSGVPAFIRFESNTDVSVANFYDKLKEEFSFRSEDQLQLIKTNTDKNGFINYRYQQLYKGLKVVGAEYLLHEKNGKLVSANGKFIPLLNLSATPLITQEASIEQGIQHVNFSGFRYDKEIDKQSSRYYPKPVLVIAPVNGNYNGDDFRLCWNMDIYGARLDEAVNVFIDANTGIFVNSVSLIHDQDVASTAATLYNGTQPVTSFYNSGSGNYSLSIQQAGPWSSQEINTFDGMHDSLSYYGGSLPFFYQEIESGTSSFTADSIAANIHWGLEKVYNFYVDSFSRNSYDDAGSRITAFAHYGVNYNNAFWNPMDSIMVFGDGNNLTYGPLVDIDIVGHEFSHGVTWYTAALQYQGESGALNESFSDIMGVSLKQIVLGPSASWTLGVNTVLIANHYMRNMANPNLSLYPCPDTYMGTYWVSTSSSYDNGGVHYNSGVQNFWYYLLVNGGTGTNDNGDLYNVSGIGLSDALKIVYRSQVNYMFPTAMYYDAYLNSQQAAIDLFGASSSQVKSVEDAWCAVGVGPCATPWGVNDLNRALSIHVYPNPANSLIAIVLNGNRNGSNISVVNVLGETVLTATAGIQQKNISLDVSNLQNGVYFIRVNYSLTISESKIVIQH